MASIELSPGLENLTAKRVVDILNGNSTNRGFLYFMKGTIPSALNNVTNPSVYRVDDRLVRWNSRQATIIDGSKLSVSAATSIRSGEATWFYWYRKTSTAVYQLAGTISKVGDGGEIELSNTRILAGRTYSFSDLGLNFERSYYYTLTTELPVPTPAPTPAPPPPPAIISVFPSTAIWTVPILS